MSFYKCNQGKRMLLAEIYMPKNILNDSASCAVLQEAIEFEPAKTWLIENHVDLYNNSTWQPAVSNAAILAEMLLKMEKTVYGWSVYGVDGVFESDSGRAISEMSDAVHLIEERTQVIRILCDVSNKQDSFAIDPKKQFDALTMVNEFIARRIAERVEREEEVWVQTTTVGMNVFNLNGGGN